VNALFVQVGIELQPYAETMSQDVLRRLRVSIRDEATVGAAKHGVSTHVMQLEQVFVFHSSPICGNTAVVTSVHT
jgi:hypothetical protein